MGLVIAITIALMLLLCLIFSYALKLSFSKLAKISAISVIALLLVISAISYAKNSYDLAKRARAQKEREELFSSIFKINSAIVSNDMESIYFNLNLTGTRPGRYRLTAWVPDFLTETAFYHHDETIDIKENMTYSFSTDYEDLVMKWYNVSGVEGLDFSLDNDFELFTNLQYLDTPYTEYVYTMNKTTFRMKAIIRKGVVERMG